MPNFHNFETQSKTKHVYYYYSYIVLFVFSYDFFSKFRKMLKILYLIGIINFTKCSKLRTLQKHFNSISDNNKIQKVFDSA